MQPKFFDIHSHLNFSDFDPAKSTDVDHGASSDREEVIKRMLDAGVWTIIVGSNLEDSKKAIEIAEKHEEGVYATVGIHPTDHLGVELPSEFGELAKHPKVVAIGECGLDFFRNPEIRNPKSEARNKQIELFKQQIELAIELDKPLVIHCREAHEDLLSILRLSFKMHGSRLRGHLHFFGGEGAWENKDEYLSMGFLLSFTGIVTFPNYSHEEDLKNIPLDKIMIETDAPFVAPVPYRGKRNEPAYVVEVAKKIAEIRGINVEEVAKTTTQNALKLFGIKT